jgi:hypothetical protein
MGISKNSKKSPFSPGKMEFLEVPISVSHHWILHPPVARVFKNIELKRVYT